MKLGKQGGDKGPRNPTPTNQNQVKEAPYPLFFPQTYPAGKSGPRYHYLDTYKPS